MREVKGFSYCTYICSDSDIVLLSADDCWTALEDALDPCELEMKKGGEARGLFG